MIRSRPVEIDGRFVGVAVTQDGSLRFIAIDPAARGAEGIIFPTPAAMQRRVRAALQETGLPPVRQAG
ncbi:hypothetical protein [Teichococcus aestuarii]|uniref:Uncharacterized protein n=1 Tax=Teichococcus aestuarii TaxID=568898 RepID=A0A2U1V9G3_9PROT|nr:hypothetical protein [Pseudoroseomonas aestuarii]PWC30561.1 hypothetical protein CR165_01255 [Pseudoroseomonas aestuarii]